MRLVLVFSGFLAAVAAATSDAPRGTLLSTLTGRVDDAAAPDRDDAEFADVAAPAFEGDAKNVSTVELWYQGAAKHYDEFSIFAGIKNETKLNATWKAMTTIHTVPPRSDRCEFLWDEECTDRKSNWTVLFGLLELLVFLLRSALNIYFFFETLWYAAGNWRTVLEKVRTDPTMVVGMSVFICLDVYNAGIITVVRDVGVMRTVLWLMNYLCYILASYMDFAYPDIGDFLQEIFYLVTADFLPTWRTTRQTRTLMTNFILLVLWSKPSSGFRFVATELNLNSAIAFDQSAADPVATVGLLPGAHAILFFNACLAALGVHFALSKLAENNCPHPETKVLLFCKYTAVTIGEKAGLPVAWVPWFRYLGMLRCAMLVYEFMPSARLFVKFLHVMFRATLCELPELYAIVARCKTNMSACILAASVVNYAVVVGMGLYFLWGEGGPTARREEEGLAWFCLRTAFQLGRCLVCLFITRLFERCTFFLTVGGENPGGKSPQPRYGWRRVVVDLTSACGHFLGMTYTDSIYAWIRNAFLIACCVVFFCGFYNGHLPAELKDRIAKKVYISQPNVACVLVAIAYMYLGPTVPWSELVDAISPRRLDAPTIAAALPSWTAYVLDPLRYGWGVVTRLVGLFCGSGSIRYASGYVFGDPGPTSDAMKLYLVMALVADMCCYFTSISAICRVNFLMQFVGKVLVVRQEFTSNLTILDPRSHFINAAVTVIIAIDWLMDTNTLIQCLGAGTLVLLFCIAFSIRLRDFLRSNFHPDPVARAGSYAEDMQCVKEGTRRLARALEEALGDDTRVGEPATRRPVAARSRPEPAPTRPSASTAATNAATASYQAQTADAERRTADAKRQTAALKVERLAAERQTAALKAERLAAERQTADAERRFADAKRQTAALKAERLAAERQTADAERQSADTHRRFAEAERRTAEAERRAAAAEEERRAAAAAEAKRRAAKAERRARAEAEARAARAAEELIAAEEAAAAAAASKRSKKKKKKGRASSSTAEAPPPPREEAKDETPVPAPAARRTLADLVAAEEASAGPAPAPPTETPPDSTILPLLQEDVEADPAVAALLAKVGLERLAVDFAREQIDATTLPLLAVEDLVDVGLSTADAERVVAAVAPAPPGPAEVPENLCCPISMELMTQPVISADGFTYDRASIEAWLARGKTTSPTTGAPLAHTHLTPNHLVKSMIAEYQESKG